MKGTRICKICGREYEYCKTNRETGAFRWQDVACCPEHGAKYFAEIARSRGEAYQRESDDDGFQREDELDESEDESFYEELDESEEDDDIEE